MFWSFEPKGRKALVLTYLHSLTERAAVFETVGVGSIPTGDANEG